MKKLLIFTFTLALLGSCAQESSTEERYIYEEDKIVDVETGDEYVMDETENVTIMHQDGTTEKVAIDETPFYGTALSDTFLMRYEANLAERQQQLLENKRNKLATARTEKYANLSDDELMAQFQKSHKENEDMGIQLEMIAELITRGAVTSDEAPNLLEISPEMFNLDSAMESSLEN